MDSREEMVDPLPQATKQDEPWLNPWIPSVLSLSPGQLPGRSSPWQPYPAGGSDVGARHPASVASASGQRRRRGPGTDRTPGRRNWSGQDAGRPQRPDDMKNTSKVRTAGGINHQDARPAGQIRARVDHHGIANPIPPELSYFNFQPLEVVSRYRDSQLQVGENYSYSLNLRQNMC